MALILSHLPEMCNKEINHFTPEVESVPLKALQNTDVEILLAHMVETMDKSIINKWDKDEDYSLPMAKLDDSKVSIKIEEIHIKWEEGSENCTFNGIDQKESTWPVVSGKIENIYVTQEENVINEVLSNTRPDEGYQEYPIIQKHLDLPKNSYNFEQLYCHRDVRSKLVCDDVQAQNNNFDTNFLNHENLPNIGMLKCEIGKYQTEHKGQLNNHTKPSEMKIFKSNSCAYEAKHKGVLKGHMLIHKKPSEIKMFKCEICPFEAKQKLYLKTHMFTHKKTELKKFKCDICTYEAKQKFYLKTHMLIHKKTSELKMFKCEICTYEAKQKIYLKTHMLIHKKTSELKMFKCEICTYQAKRKSFLNNHMLIHKITSELKMF